MNWSDETVENVAKAIFKCDGAYGDKAKAALAAVAGCSEVKALVELMKRLLENSEKSLEKPSLANPLIAMIADEMRDTLTPFTEASNG